MMVIGNGNHQLSAFGKLGEARGEKFSIGPQTSGPGGSGAALLPCRIGAFGCDEHIGAMAWSLR
jgi:hypothetical protein